MKVYLINPPAPERYIREGRCMQKSGVWTTLWPPITLALSAALLEEKGFTVRLDDCSSASMTFGELKNEIARFSPDLLVMSTSTPSMIYDLNTVKNLKEAFSSLSIAALGVHVTVSARETLEECPALDFVICGEPEGTIAGLAEALAAERDFAKVAGLAWRDEGSVRVNERRPWLEDLDALPFPAWHLIDRNLYRLPISRRPFLTLFSARGCPYHCIFCADDPYYGKKIRRRSPVRIVDEIEHNMKEFGIRDFLFWTESFTASRDLVLAVCEEIEKRKLVIEWFCNSRVDHVDSELLRAMKHSGCQMISFGVESFTPSVLKAIKKGTTAGQAEEAIKLTHQAGLQVIAHCILGLPGETEETMRHTIKRIVELPVDYAQFYAAVPFPGSELYTMAVEKGWLDGSNHDWTRFEQETCLLSTDPGLSPERLKSIRDDAYRRFYVRPRFIFGFIRSFLRDGNLRALMELWQSFGASLLKR